MNRRDTVLKIILCILIVMLLGVLYIKYNKKELKTAINEWAEYKDYAVEERQYKKEHADKLIKSSEYIGEKYNIYIDIYKLDNGQIILDRYTNDLGRVDVEASLWEMPIGWDVNSENIKIEWKKYDYYVEAKIIVTVNGESYTLPVQYYF